MLMTDVKRQLENAYIRGFRAAVGGKKQPVPLPFDTQYVKGFNYGNSCLANAWGRAEDLAVLALKMDEGTKGR